MMFLFIVGHILRGKSLMRTLLNYEVTHHTLHGKVLDVGSGENPSYYRYFKKAPGAEVLKSDMRLAPVDFEKDPLPYADASADQALLCNVLEHVFNHAFLAREVARVLKPGGQLLGFVPFFMQVHPDPYDYFRYTKEALEKILGEAGFRDIVIKEIGLGPVAIHFNNLASFMPRIFTILYLPCWYITDHIFVWLRPRWRVRFPLAYFFDARR